MGRSEKLELSQWLAMAVELLEITETRKPGIFDRGGKPSREGMIGCFTLSKDKSELTVDGIDLKEFERCLVYFTGEILKKEPGAKYKVLPFKEKFELVLLCAAELDGRKRMLNIGHGRKKEIRSEAWKKMKQEKRVTKTRKGRDSIQVNLELDGSLFGSNKLGHSLRKEHYLRHSANESVIIDNWGSLLGFSESTQGSSKSHSMSYSHGSGSADTPRLVESGQFDKDNLVMCQLEDDNEEDDQIVPNAGVRSSQAYVE